jgi:bla regulator protein blaR1
VKSQIAEGRLRIRIPEVLRTGRPALVGLIAAVFIVATPRAQSPATSVASATFDVTSVKPNKTGPGGPSMMQNQPGGRLTATNVPVRLLIQNAYRPLQGFQILGGPAWLATDRFDIVAKASGDLATAMFGAPGSQSNDPTPMQLAMRALLADRFKLVVHRETRELPIYALVLARSDKKLGAGIHPSTVDCGAVAAARGRGGAPPPGPPPIGERPICGMMSGFGVLSAGGTTLTQLVAVLSNAVGRTVLDQTGLTGAFDVDLKWTPDQLPQRPPGAPGDQPITVNGTAIDPNGPSIFTALQEQLGLKLDSTKGPMEVLVIDSVEQPTED